MQNQIGYLVNGVCNDGVVRGASLAVPALGPRALLAQHGVDALDGFGVQLQLHIHQVLGAEGLAARIALLRPVEHAELRLALAALARGDDGAGIWAACPGCKSLGQLHRHFEIWTDGRRSRGQSGVRVGRTVR